MRILSPLPAMIGPASAHRNRVGLEAYPESGTTFG
jgi:hypothetical protein